MAARVGGESVGWNRTLARSGGSLGRGLRRRAAAASGGWGQSHLGARRWRRRQRPGLKSAAALRPWRPRCRSAVHALRRRPGWSPRREAEATAGASRWRMWRAEPAAARPSWELQRLRMAMRGWSDGQIGQMPMAAWRRPGLALGRDGADGGHGKAPGGVWGQDVVLWRWRRRPLQAATAVAREHAHSGVASHGVSGPTAPRVARPDGEATALHGRTLTSRAEARGLASSLARGCDYQSTTTRAAE